MRAGLPARIRRPVCSSAQSAAAADTIANYLRWDLDYTGNGGDDEFDVEALLALTHTDSYKNVGNVSASSVASGDIVVNHETDGSSSTSIENNNENNSKKIKNENIIDENIESNNKVNNFQIKNILGQTLLMDKFSVSANSINLHYSLVNLPDGIYFVEIKSDKKLF